MKQRIKDKGWLLKDVAARWGLSDRHMTNIVNNPKQIHIDAIAGLPDKTQDQEEHF